MAPQRLFKEAQVRDRPLFSADLTDTIDEQYRRTEYARDGSDKSCAIMTRYALSLHIPGVYESTPPYRAARRGHIKASTPLLVISMPLQYPAQSTFPAMSVIKNVAVIGAAGNVGKPITEALLAAGFNVTALTRESSSSTFPSGVAVKKVDYESVDSLKDALQGQDAVVSAAATPVVGKQSVIVDAAVAAGVKRFIPSEFGINTQTVQQEGLRTILAGKIKTVDYIKEKSKENPTFTWTGITNGLFFDWGLRLSGLGFNKDAKTAVIVDSGDTPFFASNMSFIGKAVAAILSHADKTANQYLSIASFALTRNQLLKIFEEESGAKYTVKPVKSSDLEAIGKEKLEKKDFSAFGDFLQAYLFKDGGDSAKNVELANGLLGLKDEDPRPVIKAYLDGKL
ncbi:putative NmrA-like domain-containing protein [Seiridium cardinale]